MGVHTVDGADGPAVKSSGEMVGRFFGELSSACPEWRERLIAAPAEFPAVEQKVRALFARGADLVVVGLLADAQGPALEERLEETRAGYGYPLELGRMRRVSVQLIGGTILWVTSLFCSARRRADRPKDESRPGVYVELAQFGFGNGCSPEVESKVARAVALYPSLEFAQRELEREGLKLDIKTIRRIAGECGYGLLRRRRLDVEAFRSGTLPVAKKLAGRHVVVEIDGGRARIRGDLVELPQNKGKDGAEIGTAPTDEPDGGRSRKRPKRTFGGEWREPKLVTIFVRDDQGRIDKDHEVVIDATFEGPDSIMELVAMHLYRLGGAEAASVTFVSDGAVWIWERIPKIIQLAKMEHVPKHEVLDCPHAAHHISQALTSLGFSEEERQPLYREQRTLLRNGQWRRVVDELKGLADREPANAAIWTEIDYLQRHGEAGRLMYPTYRGLGLPLGSGAIESSIRRVVNLRIKGNSIFWRQATAEAILQLRAQALTDRWDQSLTRLRELRRHDARTDWKWQPRDMRSQLEPDFSKSG